MVTHILEDPFSAVSTAHFASLFEIYKIDTLSHRSEFTTCVFNIYFSQNFGFSFFVPFRCKFMKPDQLSVEKKTTLLRAFMSFLIEKMRRSPQSAVEKLFLSFDIVHHRSLPSDMRWMFPEARIYLLSESRFFRACHSVTKAAVIRHIRTTFLYRLFAGCSLRLKRTLYSSSLRENWTDKRVGWLPQK